MEARHLARTRINTARLNGERAVIVTFEGHIYSVIKSDYSQVKVSMHIHGSADEYKDSSKILNANRAKIIALAAEKVMGLDDGEDSYPGLDDSLRWQVGAPGVQGIPEYAIIEQFGSVGVMKSRLIQYYAERIVKEND